MSVKGNVFDNRKNKYEKINRFRNVDIIQHLSSLVVQENVRSGE